MKKFAARFVFFTCLILTTLPNSVYSQSFQPAAFVVNNVGDSVASFTVDESGLLKFVDIVATGEGPQTIAVSPNGRFLAIGHGTASETFEELRIYEVLADATLVEVENALVPDSPLNARWLNDNILAITETSLTGANFLNTYQFDDETATLTAVDGEETGDFCYSIAVVRGGSFAFVNNTFGDASIVSLQATDTGELTEVETQVIEPLFAVAIDASPDGNFLYGAGGISGSGNEIIGFSIDGGGSLAPIINVQSPGGSPKVIDMTDDGTILVAGHGSDATVRSFLRNAETGELVPSGFSYDVGSRGNLGDLAVVGDLMFITDESTTDDGVRGIATVRIQPDGSFSVVNPVLDTGGSRPEALAVWPGQSRVLLGDINRDGDVNLLDVGPFVDLLSNLKFQIEADINGDGEINLLDVGPFVEILSKI